MFGRKKHRARPLPLAPELEAPSAPVFEQERLLAAIHAVMNEQIGADGRWTLVRREDDDSDSIFHRVAARSLTREIAEAVLTEFGEHSSGEHTAPTTSSGERRDAQSRDAFIASELDAIPVWSGPADTQPVKAQPSEAVSERPGTRVDA